MMHKVSPPSRLVWVWKISEDTLSSEEIKNRTDHLILRALAENWGEWVNEAAPPSAASISRSQLHRMMEGGGVTLEGQPIKRNTKLLFGQTIELYLSPPKPLHLVPENRPIEILYQDEHLLVLNKPPGLTVHPSETQKEGTLVHALLHHVKDLSGIGGTLRPGIVHRIDKDTSGALVVTKTDFAHQKLAELFSKHQIERTYWAFCFSAPQSPAGTIKSLLGRHSTDRKKMSLNVKSGRTAITHYKVLESYINEKQKIFASLIECKLETGRTHQVRVHLSSVGCSVLGDPVYGFPTDRNAKWTALPESIQPLVKALPGQALHARTLGFTHPHTGKELCFFAEMPEALTALANALKNYRSS